ncbi:MAG: hypothetical protein JXR30_01990 [Alphaproteobacteria bacterium]|nr:hypothetical protein [Alphaproteobacteria bacterium]
MKKLLISTTAFLLSSGAMAQYAGQDYYSRGYSSQGSTTSNYNSSQSSQYNQIPPQETTSYQSKSQRTPDLAESALKRSLENPFFMPKEGQVFSKTTLEFGGRDADMRYSYNTFGMITPTGADSFNIESSTDAQLVVVEEFGFGISDSVTFYARAGYAEVNREYINKTTDLTTLEIDSKDPMGVTAGLSLQAIRNASMTANFHAEYTVATDNDISGYRDQFAVFAVLGKETEDVAFALHLGALMNQEGEVSGVYFADGSPFVEQSSTDYIARAEVMKQIKERFSILFGLDYEMLSEETAGGAEDNVLRGRLQLNFGGEKAMLSVYGGYETHSIDEYRIPSGGLINETYVYDVKDTKGWFAGVKLGLTF